MDPHLDISLDLNAKLRPLGFCKKTGNPARSYT
jgi:hypothetical protein